MTTLLATSPDTGPFVLFLLWLPTCIALAIVLFSKWQGYRRFPMINGAFVSICGPDQKELPTDEHCFCYLRAVTDSLDQAQDPVRRGQKVIRLTDGATVIVQSANDEAPSDQELRHYLRVARQLVEMSSRREGERSANQTTEESQDAFATTIESITADDDSTTLSV